MKRTLLSIITGTCLLLTSGCCCQKKCDTSVTSNTSKTINTSTPDNNTPATNQEHTLELKPEETQKDLNNMDKITRTASGLGYEVLTPGTGAKPTVGQTVTVHYTGYLDNNGELGKKFDSSVDRGMPFSTQIGVGRVIAGWDQGLLNMQVGETCRLYIPANLGYGARGAGAAIPPNANLIFDVQLLAVR